MSKANSVRKSKRTAYRNTTTRHQIIGKRSAAQWQANIAGVRFEGKRGGGLDWTAVQR